MDNNGFIYLKVDGRIVAPFLNMIPKDVVLHPKEVTDPDKDVGAHISVMRGSELGEKKVKEIGREYNFFIEGLESVKPEGWDGIKKVYFVAVSSPALETLRARYGLTRKYKGHDFHITVGVERE
jgi:hypothetical protein